MENNPRTVMCACIYICICMRTKHIHSRTSANIKSCFLYIRVVGRIIVKHNIILVWWCSMTLGLPSSAGWSGWYGFTGQIHGLRSQETLVSTLDSSLLAVISHWLFVGFRYYINLHKPLPIFRTWNSCLKLVCQICVLGATKWFLGVFIHASSNLPHLGRRLNANRMLTPAWVESDIQGQLERVCNTLTSLKKLGPSYVRKCCCLISSCKWSDQITWISMDCFIMIIICVGLLVAETAFLLWWRFRSSQQATYAWWCLSVGS